MEESIPNLLLNTRWAFLPEGYDGFCERLRIYREERMTLGTDTKILTAWNGLMLMALSPRQGRFQTGAISWRLKSWLGSWLCPCMKTARSWRALMKAN